MLNKIKKLISLKYDFRLLKKREILILCYSIHLEQFNFLQEKFAGKLQTIYYEKKNFFIFTISLFLYIFNQNKNKNFDLIYYSNLIRFSGAKVLISDIDNNYNFYLIKSFLKIKISTILIQNGLRSYTNDIFSFLDSRQEERKIDHFIIWGKNLKRV